MAHLGVKDLGLEVEVTELGWRVCCLAAVRGSTSHIGAYRF